MLDRGTAPNYGKIETPDLVHPKKHTLSNGETLHYIDGGASGVLRFEIVLKSGVWHESSPGLSWFAANMLREGTTNHSAQEIAEILEYNGAFLEINPGFDNTSITLSCMKDSFEDPIKVLREMLLHPTFPEEELTTLKNIRTQQINVNSAKNGFIASRAIRSLIFGKDHPYGRSLEADQIPAITRQDLLNYYSQNFFNEIEYFVSGDVGQGELDLINNTFSELKSQESKKQNVPGGFLNPDQMRITKPESLQASIRLGLEIPGKNHDDHFLIRITNEILGGYFGSRLMKNLREEKGYTYGVHSRPLHLQEETFLIISTDVMAESIEDALKQIKFEMNELSQNMVSFDELNTVRNYMAGTFLSGVSTPFELMDKFKSIHSYGLSYDYYEKYFVTLKNVTQEDIMSTSRKYFNEANLFEVIVG